MRSGYKNSLNGRYESSSSPVGALICYDISLSLDDLALSLGVLEVFPTNENGVLLETECDGVGGGIQNCGAFGVWGLSGLYSTSGFS